MANKHAINRIQQIIGLEGDAVGHTEKWLSGLGAVFGIYAIFLISPLFISGSDVPLVVASMGASSVLLFATPHSKLAQPWNLCAGHVISAIVGVTCAKLIPHTALASAVAVGLAVTAMYYTYSIHPPGGATALMATIGGPSIEQLGFAYVITPVLVDTLTLLAIAIGFNLLFKWRRYPVGLFYKIDKTAEAKVQARDLQFALQKLGGFVDVSEKELESLFTMAYEHALTDHLPIDVIHKDHYYSNGDFGSEWAVRHIIDGPDKPRDGKDRLIYKVVAGDGLYDVKSCTRSEFSRWARYEVTREESEWKRC